MSYFSFLDFLLFVFLVQFIFIYKNSLLSILFSIFLSELRGYMTLHKECPQSGSFSSFFYLVILSVCFGSYFSYSCVPFGMLEFVFVFSVVAWFATVLNYMAGNKYALYFHKSGEGVLKAFSNLWVEILSELSRPVALTVRLFVNVTAGHMLGGAINSLALSFGVFYSGFSMLAIFAECVVFGIQSFVFARLICLYMLE
uniref:ATP synthase F0 subunit 6 n=1 Tax=Ascaridia columbae TaxID=65462 RepID=S4UFZ1_9BILA|nr:ATP synthase F0 subunit 6 [Ascaridia columbae]AGI96021.1 ATP synthase F0 subunit 6 [Ascaridia columbae]